MRKHPLLILLTLVVLCAIIVQPISAVSLDMSGEDTNAEILVTSDTPVSYYIAFMSDGQMITNSNFDLVKFTYSTSASNIEREWIFEPVGDGTYYICSAQIQ